MYKETFRIDEDGPKRVPGGLQEPITRYEKPRKSGGNGKKSKRNNKMHEPDRQTKVKRKKPKTSGGTEAENPPKLEDTISFRLVADNSPETRRKNKRKRKMRATLVIFGLITVLCATAYFGFPLEKIDITGNRFYGDDIVRTWILGSEYSKNTLYVVLKHKFSKQEEIPFIDSVDIKMTGRKSIEIEVYEKPVIGCVYIGGQSTFAYFDKDGIVSEISAARMDNIPMVEGLGVNAAVLFEPIEIPDSDVLNILLALVVDLKQYDLVPSEVTLDGTDISLDYGDVGVWLGKSDYLTEKVIRLSYIMPTIRENAWSGVLHLENWSYENTDVVFKKSK